MCNQRDSYRFSASTSPQHSSQKNLFLAVSISDLEKCRRHAFSDVFCEISRDRSKNGSDRDVTRSHVKQRVSLVRVPASENW